MFNVYSEKTFRSALEAISDGIILDDHCIKLKTKQTHDATHQNRRNNVSGAELERVIRKPHLGSNLDDAWDHSLEKGTLVESSPNIYYTFQKI